jgi:DNA polymerase V
VLKRPGAGRKKGSSAYGESTKAMRIPESLVPRIHALLNARNGQLQTIANLADVIYLPTPASDKRFLPLFAGKVAAGLNKRPDPISSYLFLSLLSLCHCFYANFERIHTTQSRALSKR